MKMMRNNHIILFSLSLIISFYSYTQANIIYVNTSATCLYPPSYQCSFNSSELWINGVAPSAYDDVYLNISSNNFTNYIPTIVVDDDVMELHSLFLSGAILSVKSTLSSFTITSYNSNILVAGNISIINNGNLSMNNSNLYIYGSINAPGSGSIIIENTLMHVVRANSTLDFGVLYFLPGGIFYTEEDIILNGYVVNSGGIINASPNSPVIIHGNYTQLQGGYLSVSDLIREPSYGFVPVFVFGNASLDGIVMYNTSDPETISTDVFSIMYVNNTISHQYSGEAHSLYDEAKNMAFNYSGSTVQLIYELESSTTTWMGIYWWIWVIVFVLIGILIISCIAYLIARRRRAGYTDIAH